MLQVVLRYVDLPRSLASGTANPLKLPPWLTFAPELKPTAGYLAELLRPPDEPSLKGVPMFMPLMLFCDCLGVPTMKPGTVDNPIFVGSPTR